MWDEFGEFHYDRRDLHIPIEAVSVIFGVDVLMDMGRTTVNVVGNCLATVVMARWEGVQLETTAALAPARGQAVRL